MASPKTIKRPLPQHFLTRMAGLAQQRAAVDAAQNQLLGDFLGFLGVDTQRFGLWINDDENPVTYEVLARADFERRVRLKQAAAKPDTNEKPPPVAKDAG